MCIVLFCFGLCLKRLFVHSFNNWHCDFFPWIFATGRLSLMALLLRHISTGLNVRTVLLSQVVAHVTFAVSRHCARRAECRWLMRTCMMNVYDECVWCVATWRGSSDVTGIFHALSDTLTPARLSPRRQSSDLTMTMTTETSLTTRTSSSLQQRCSLLSMKWQLTSDVCVWLYCIRQFITMCQTLKLRQLFLNVSHRILGILPHCLENLSQITLYSNTNAAINLILIHLSNCNRFITFYHCDIIKG